METTRTNWHAKHRAKLTFGQRVADAVAATMGSWTFIIVQSIILIFWIALNVTAWITVVQRILHVRRELRAR